MPYSKFTLSKAVEDFKLQIKEGERFFPEIVPVNPTPFVKELLADTIPWAIAVGSEKARSEGIINPVLLDVKRQMEGKISVFSGEEFNVDPTMELNGFCDFILSKSSEQLFVKAPVLMMVEAKKEDLKPALGQCLAEMVAAQMFNRQKGLSIPVVYGAVSSGTVWKFLKLEQDLVTIDLTDYPLPPVENILGILMWIVQSS
jgi:hypothetical protein